MPCFTKNHDVPLSIVIHKKSSSDGRIESEPIGIVANYVLITVQQTCEAQGRYLFNPLTNLN
jgi:hypothetical protein